MASIYIDHKFPTHSMQRLRIEEEDDDSELSRAFLSDPNPVDDATDSVPALDLPRRQRPRRPEVPRSSTDPTSASSYIPSPPVNIHRNRSPYSRGHSRTRSSGAALSAPGMTRAHSWGGNPAAQTTDLFASIPGSVSPSSSLRVPTRTRSPFKSNDDATMYNTPQKMWYDVHGGSAIESIQEDSELDLTPRGHSSTSTYSVSRSSSLRRRPASPLHTIGAAPTHLTSFPSESPSLGAQRFNESYPSLHHYASSSSFSSISSTPTSARSRSPSISSLETIEDVPDLESEAVEIERLERFKLAAERAENGEDLEDGLRRRSLDTPRVGFGFARSNSRERKRWSVCGGERRADLDLETIWED